ncbi:hypothetical protein SEVIR_3G327890v4 [Setaria viridis]
MWPISVSTDGLPMGLDPTASLAPVNRPNPRWPSSSCEVVVHQLDTSPYSSSTRRTSGRPGIYMTIHDLKADVFEVMKEFIYADAIPADVEDLLDCCAADHDPVDNKMTMFIEKVHDLHI